jgi:hypothetical protein
VVCAGDDGDADCVGGVAGGVSEGLFQEQASDLGWSSGRDWLDVEAWDGKRMKEKERDTGAACTNRIMRYARTLAVVFTGDLA